MQNKIILGQSEAGEIALDPDKLLTTSMIVQAFSGGGKSGIIRLVCEQSPIPFIILDLEGEFASLREKVDLVLVGANGDIPTDIRSAELLARRLVDYRVSAVIDLFEFAGASRLSVVERRREYVAAFCTALMNLPKASRQPLILVLDELQVICPQQSAGHKGVVSLQPVIDVAAAGRKRGICVLGATQRFSKVHNDALAELKNVFIGGTWLDADQKRAADYLGITSTADRRALRELPKQHFFCFGPALSLPLVNKFQSNQCLTSFPKAGVSRNIEPPKASDAITAIVAQIDDLPAEAEQERRDMESLTRENADLKRQLAERPTVPEPIETVVEVPVAAITPEVFNAANDLADVLSNKIADLSRDLSENVAEFGFVAMQLRDVLRDAPMDEGNELFIPARPILERTLKADVVKPQSLTDHLLEAGERSARNRPRSTDTRNTSLSISESESANGHLHHAQVSILTVLDKFSKLGVRWVGKTNLAVFAGISPKSSAFPKHLRTLLDLGLVEITSAGVSLRDSAKSFIPRSPAIASLAELHEQWCNYLGGKLANVLRTIIPAGPETRLSKSDVAVSVGISETSSAWPKTLRQLNDYGLLDYDRDNVWLTELLFPEGLK